MIELKKLSSPFDADLPFGVARVDASRIEFQVGDAVTFNAYGSSCKAEVVGVFPRGSARPPLYGLSGEVKSITSGRCIEESQLYDPYPSLLNVPAHVLGQISNQDFLLALNTFDAGSVAQGFAEISSSLAQDSSGLADYLRACLHEAVGMRAESAALFACSLEKGFSEAAERLSLPKDDVQLVFSIGSSRPSVVVQCPRSQAADVVEFAKVQRLHHAGTLPFRGLSSPTEASDAFKIPFADRYRLPGFVREAVAGAFAQAPRLSKTPSPAF